MWLNNNIARGMRPGSLILAIVYLWGPSPGLQFGISCVQLPKVHLWTSCTSATKMMANTQHYRPLPVPTNILYYARLSITFTCQGGARLCLCSGDFILKTKYAWSLHLLLGFSMTKHHLHIFTSHIQALYDTGEEFQASA